jgi:transmembrane sensor
MSKDKFWHLITRKLTGEASSEELAELREFIRQDPALAAEIKLLEAIWARSADADGEYLEATYLLHHERMRKQGLFIRDKAVTASEDAGWQISKPARIARFNKVLLFAMALIGLLAFVWWMSLPTATVPVGQPIALAKQLPVQEVTIGNGSNSHFQLPDGSMVWLNAGSRLNYEKIKQTGLREVYLTGEAFFDVVKNPARPFIIHTATIDVKVLGTSFNVKAYPGDKTTETSLIHGSVEVSLKNRPGEKYQLKPNQKIILQNDLVMAEKPVVAFTDKRVTPPVLITPLNYLRKDSSVIETAWINNRLSFEKEPFLELGKRMERWFDVRISFTNTAIGNELMTGSFSKESLIQALDALRFTNNNAFNYTIEEKEVLIY